MNPIKTLTTSDQILHQLINDLTKILPKIKGKKNKKQVEAIINHIDEAHTIIHNEIDWTKLKT